MTIKSMTRRKGIKQLVEYVFRDQPKDGKPVMQLKHNLSGGDRERWVKQMEFNHGLRKVKTKNAIQVYHEIISFHKEDSDRINRTMLLDIGKKYIELRGKTNQVIMREHRDKDHRHIHVVMSATEFLTGKSSRISKKEFEKFRVEMEKFQREKYPELTKSIVYTKGKDLKQNFMDKREAGKEKMRSILDKLFNQSKSQEELIKQLKDNSIEPYFRSGRLAGVLDDKDMKFRFSNLGFDMTSFEDKVSEETEIDKKIDELESIRNSTTDRGIDRELELTEEENTTNEEDTEDVE
ncbi:MAG: relaxase/mobilization nuclease domain-containing protein [Chitinophagaceae bacterium]|nr:relaxase/mobilization nuclease domain-containing protein [Chitinophagaceae bacterium]